MKKDRDVQTHSSSHGQHNHTTTTNIKLAFGLNFSFTLIEIAGGIFTNSVAIISSALHDLGDSLSLGLAWYFQGIAKRRRDAFYTFGYKRFSVLGAVINSFVLVIGSMLVLHETIPRLFKPEASHVQGMLILAIVGIVVNGAAVLRLKKGNSLNEKVVSLHLLEDVLSWAAIFVGSIVMTFVYIPILDPILSIAITCFILVNVYKNLKISMRIFLQAVPVDIDIETIKANILTIPGTVDVHDIHTWSMDGEYNIMSMHLVLEKSTADQEIKKIKEKVKSTLKNIKLHHVTIETEFTGDCGKSQSGTWQENCIEEMVV